MKRYKLTITKYLDRKGLADILRKIYYHLSIRERLHIVDNLPFTDEERWAEESSLQNILSPYCEFTCEEIPFNGNEYAVEDTGYILARKWYDSLPEEDRKKIDVLISGSIPCG